MGSIETLALNWSLVDLPKMKELLSCNLIRTMILIDTLFQFDILKERFRILVIAETEIGRGYTG